VFKIVKSEGKERRPVFSSQKAEDEKDRKIKDCFTAAEKYS